ncbi:hypothetical protein [Halobacterium zhouii]|nr:hypothetical protein [Halobacterium zhouii]
MTTTLHATDLRSISGASGRSAGVKVSGYYPNAQSAFTHSA